MVPVDAHNVVAIVGPEMFKTTVLERVFEVKALVVRLVVSVPVIVVHVLRAVYFAVGAMLGFRFGVRLALRRRSGHAPLICPRGIGTVGFEARVAPLLEGCEPFSGISAAAAGQGDTCPLEVSRALRGTVVISAVELWRTPSGGSSLWAATELVLAGNHNVERAGKHQLSLVLPSSAIRRS